MADEKRNTLSAKVKRTVTSVLPVATNRKGRCIGCGECCKLPKACPFIRFKSNRLYCSIYPVRPLNCRKYPRTESEWLTKEACGFKFG